MLIMRHYTKEKYKIYGKYKYSELCFCLAQTTRIFVRRFIVEAKVSKFTKKSKVSSNT
jgi:hypothetical protein